jgi:hypothetical protein
LDNFIRRTYANLTRCLKIDGSPGPFTLGNVVQPVIPLSSCLDQVALGLSADGAATEDSQITAALEAGVYRISWVHSRATNTATDNTSYLLVNLGSIVSPVLFLTIAKITYFTVGDDSHVGSVEINVPESAKIEAIAGALGASNRSNWRVVIQPL